MARGKKNLNKVDSETSYLLPGNSGSGFFSSGTAQPPAVIEAGRLRADFDLRDSGVSTMPVADEIELEGVVAIRREEQIRSGAPKASCVIL